MALLPEIEEALTSGQLQNSRRVKQRFGDQWATLESAQSTFGHMSPEIQRGWFDRAMELRTYDVKDEIKKNPELAAKIEAQKAAKGVEWSVGPDGGIKYTTLPELQELVKQGAINERQASYLERGKLNEDAQRRLLEQGKAQLASMQKKAQMAQAKAKMEQQKAERAAMSPEQLQELKRQQQQEQYQRREVVKEQNVAKQQEAREKDVARLTNLVARDRSFKQTGQIPEHMLNRTPEQMSRLQEAAQAAKTRKAESIAKIDAAKEAKLQEQVKARDEAQRQSMADKRAYGQAPAEVVERQKKALEEQKQAVMAPVPQTVQPTTAGTISAPIDAMSSPAPLTSVLSLSSENMENTSPTLPRAPRPMPILA